MRVMASHRIGGPGRGRGRGGDTASIPVPASGPAPARHITKRVADLAHEADADAPGAADTGHPTPPGLASGVGRRGRCSVQRPS